MGELFSLGVEVLGSLKISDNKDTGGSRVKGQTPLRPKENK